MHCLPCSNKFSMTLQTEFFSTETHVFLKQIIFHISFIRNVPRVYNPCWHPFNIFTKNLFVAYESNNNPLDIVVECHKVIISISKYSRLSLSRLRLSRITAYLEEKI